MTSSISVTLQQNGEESVDVKESKRVSTIQRIYREDNENIIVRDPTSRRSFINKSAYAKLHRSLSSGTKRHSVDNLKGRFENLVRQNSESQDQNRSEEEKKTNEIIKKEEAVIQPEVTKKTQSIQPETVEKEPITEPEITKKESINEPEITKKELINKPAITKKEPINEPEITKKTPLTSPEVVARESINQAEIAKQVTPQEVVEKEPLSQPEVAKEGELKKSLKGEPVEETKFTPASFGYPKTAKLVPPLIKPKPVLRKRTSKDENSNLIKKISESNDEISIVLRKSESEESIDKIAKELSIFTMDGKSKEHKRTSSFKKRFMSSFFGKDKKKKEDDKNKLKYGDSVVHNDNMRNESNFSRQSPQKSSVTYPVQNVPVSSYNDHIRNVPVNNGNDTNSRKEQEIHEEQIKELEQKYAELHVNRFNQIRQMLNEEKTEDYVPMDNAKKKPSISDYISTPVNKYIDTSSTASTESEKPNGVVARDTPPRAQETYQNFKLVKPKASIPINSERSLPNPYQNEKTSPRTIERNLNKSNSKDYPDKASFSSNQDNTYSTVFDSLEYSTSRNGEIKPINSRASPGSPKSPSVESTKLKLPPNREVYDVQPRVKSPIPSNRVSTDKIIATELLKNTRSPTPPKRTVSKPPENVEEVIMTKPPISPKLPPKKPSPVNQNQSDKIVTNALVHAPRRAQTPLENRTYSNIQGYRASTPVNLRMLAARNKSPQKEDMRRSVEEYYWKELKKLKEEEDSKLYFMHMNGYYDDAYRVRRSRSLSPSAHKGGRRSLSLPRDTGELVYVDYPRVPQQSIPEGRPLVTDDHINRQFIYDQNFVRNDPERRSVDSLQRPIFRRGSLTKPEVYEAVPYNKKVSFSNSQAPLQVWPTRDGFTQNPPQRRIERNDSELDDEVFFRNSPGEPKYWTRNEPIYSNRILEQFRAQPVYEPRGQQVAYGQVQLGPRRLSMDSIPRSGQDIYVSRRQLLRRPITNAPPGQMVDDYGRSPRFQQYPNNSQLSLQRDPVYSSRQSMTDSNYGQKQVTVRNKVCDMYGQIHDAPQTGIVMGRIQDSTMVPRQPYTQPPPESFVRGSRLTASANDMGKRYADPRYGYEINQMPNNYDNRPLPPTPSSKKPMPHPQISDTESGSDASEVQRIMQSKTKNKKRGFFGK